MNDTYITSAEAALLIGVKRETINTLVHRGKLHTVKIEGLGKCLLLRQEVMSYKLRGWPVVTTQATPTIEVSPDPIAKSEQPSTGLLGFPDWSTIEKMVAHHIAMIPLASGGWCFTKLP